VDVGLLFFSMIFDETLLLLDLFSLSLRPNIIENRQYIFHFTNLARDTDVQASQASTNSIYVPLYQSAKVTRPNPSILLRVLCSRESSHQYLPKLLASNPAILLSNSTGNSGFDFPVCQIFSKALLNFKVLLALEMTMNVLMVRLEVHESMDAVVLKARYFLFLESLL
jgi:hypothetical protein